MMTYGFKARFAHALVMDTKLTTIRAPRKDGRLPKPGEVIRRYTGMRTKNCRHLGDCICKRVLPIVIEAKGVMLNGVSLSGAGRNAVAWKDGFTNWEEMIEFFSTVHDLPFHGYLIEWFPNNPPQ
jgi:hypothetical protein